MQSPRIGHLDRIGIGNLFFSNSLKFIPFRTPRGLLVSVSCFWWFPYVEKENGIGINEENEKEIERKIREAS